MIIDCKKYEQYIMGRARALASGKHVSLAVVTCSDDAASKVYVRNKLKACESVGINTVHYIEKDFEDCKETIRELNNSDVTGIILQLPTKLSKSQEYELLNMIDVNKDVDGLTSKSIAYMALGDEASLPCTSLGVLGLVEQEIGYDLSGKTVALYGRSDLVNKPLVDVFTRRNATVTLYHSKSPIDDTLGDHDISIVAIGKPRYFKINDTGKKQLIIDVGINRDENGKLCGDVDTRGFEDNPNIYYTPVPKGVGILTCASLCYKLANMSDRLEICEE